MLSVVIFFMRLWIPESPRWLITHGRSEEARAIVEELEDSFRRQGHTLKGPPFPCLRLQARRHTRLIEVARTLLKHRQRTLVALVLMLAQAFFYNAIFFSYALVLTDFYGVRADRVGWYILPFAAGNVLGPLILGRFFDTIGRKPMLALTYGASGVLLALSGSLFALGWLTAAAQTVAWMVIFFFASTAASAAYLTAAETFPLEIRALAIAFFYAVGTGVGGVVAPWLFGVLIDTGSRLSVFGGYLFGSLLMVAAALVAARWAVAAERKPLEAVALPLSLSQ
jgi:MFS family permease